MGENGGQESVGRRSKSGVVTEDCATIEKHGARREINQIIDHLRDLSDEGHAYIKVGMVADMWAGDDKDKPWVWSPKLRKTKRAMAEGRIDYQQRSARQNPGKSSDAKIADVIAYFEGL